MKHVFNGEFYPFHLQKPPFDRSTFVHNFHYNDNIEKMEPYGN